MTITLIRAIIIYVFITASIRIMGKRQVGELNPQELVITILISAVATIPLEDNGMPLANCLIPIALFISFEILNSAIGMKSTKFRNIIQGRPIFIIKDGEIQQNQLKKLRFTTDDLNDAVRQAGVFDISQVQNAVVETNGVVTVQKKAEFTPISPSTLKLDVEESEIPITVIIDGKVIEDYYSNVFKNKDIIKLTAVENGEQVQNIMLMNISKDGSAYIVKKEQKK